MTEPFLGVNPWTALFTLLNTLTIFFVGKKYLFAPIMKIIQERQAELDSLYADANAAKKQAQFLEAEYAQKLSVAGDTCERLVKEAVARGQAREEGQGCAGGVAGKLSVPGYAVCRGLGRCRLRIRPQLPLLSAL